MPRYPDRVAIVLALALLAGCAVPPAPAKIGKDKGGTPRATASKEPTPIRPAGGLPAPSEAPRQVPQAGPGELTSFVGKVKLISDHGAAIISNNTAGIIANNGGAIIANNSSGLIANNGGGLVAKAKRQLLQAPAESLLAEAVVEVLDGEGRVLVDEAGKPITATTDQQGGYAFKARLPAENLVLRVRLFPNGGARAAGGQLLATLPRGGTTSEAGSESPDMGRVGGTAVIDLDTASSLGTAYVLEKYVQRRPGVLDKLPAAEAGALKREVAAAVTQLAAGAPTYAVADQVAAAEALRGKAKGLDETLERIRAILVAGTSIRGGRPAREVALAGPLGVAGDGKGTLFVGEFTGGRLRALAPDGTMALFAGGVSTTAGKDGDDALRLAFESPQGLAVGPDGHLYVADRLRNHVRRIERGPDGVARVYVVAGDGRAALGAVDVKATATSLRGPAAIAFSPDGRLHIVEQPQKGGFSGRLLAIDPDGTLRELPVPPPAPDESRNLVGLAFWPDGTLAVVDDNAKKIRRRAVDGTWTDLWSDPGLNFGSMPAVGPDGTLFVCVDAGNAVMAITPDGKATRLAGTGEPGYAGDGGPAAAALLNQPAGIWVDPAGTLYVADYGNTVVRAIDLKDPARPIRTVAGTQALARQGDALAIAISNPAALALDPTDRLVVSETSGHTVRLLDGDRLTVLAGRERGFAGDGGQASAARFDTPSALTYRGDDLYVIDGTNHRVRRIAKDGTVSTVVGDGSGPRKKGERRRKPEDAGLVSGVALVVGPDGLNYWPDNFSHQVLRLAADGMVEIVAGSLAAESGDSGDGGPAADAVLANPTSLAFDAKGDLYVADTGNMRIRRITGLVGGAPTIHPVAGVGALGTLARLADLATATGEEPARDAVLVGPVSLAVTPDGDLLVGETGAAKLKTLIGLVGIGDVELAPVGSRIRRISDPGGPAPRIRSVAGHGTSLLNDALSDDSLNLPIGLLIDREGRLVIADSGNNQIKLLPKGAY